MLSTIKQALNTVPDVPFSEYYQEYITCMEDLILSKEVHSVEKNVFTLSDITKLMKELNKLHQGVSQ